MVTPKRDERKHSVQVAPHRGLPIVVRDITRNPDGRGVSIMPDRPLA